MPLPEAHPESGQTQKEFIAACMGSKVIQNDFKTQEQRLAVCFQIWKKATKGKGEDATASWTDAETEIKSSGVIEDGEKIHLILPEIK
jgi:hypothetical protein